MLFRSGFSHNDEKSIMQGSGYAKNNVNAKINANFASVGCVGNVILGQFLYGSENRVGTACAKCRMKREVIHQMSGDILDA